VTVCNQETQKLLAGTYTDESDSRAGMGEEPNLWQEKHLLLRCRWEGKIGRKGG